MPKFDLILRSFEIVMHNSTKDNCMIESLAPIDEAENTSLYSNENLDDLSRATLNFVQREAASRNLNIKGYFVDAVPGRGYVKASAKYESCGKQCYCSALVVYPSGIINE